MNKIHGFIKNEDKPCKYKWVNSFVSVFLVLHVNEIFLNGNDIPYITENKNFIVIIVLHKTLRKSISHNKNKDL